MGLYNKSNALLHSNLYYVFVVTVHFLNIMYLNPSITHNLNIFLKPSLRYQMSDFHPITEVTEQSKPAQNSTSFDLYSDQ